MLGIDYNFNTILKTKKNCALTWFHFYTSLNQRKACLQLPNAWLVLIPQLKKLVALLQHEVQRLKQMPPKLRFIQLQRRMK